MYRIFTSFRLPEDQYKAYAEIVGDTILGFYRITDIPRLLQQKLKVSADDSQRITSKLIDFLSPLVKREEEEAQAKKAELNKLADTFASPEGITAKGATPIDTENVEPIRTMEEDMHRVHGYGAYREAQDKEDAVHQSSQDDVLKS
jgi:hypothetical protein